MTVQAQAILDRIEALLPVLGGSAISASAYDTAHVAMLRSPDGMPMFSSSGRWLLENQREDGSWGGSVEIAHDRCLCTLAALVALAELARDGHLPPTATAPAIVMGTTYLKTMLGELSSALRETAGFELVFPPLVERAKRLDLDLPQEDFGWLHRRRQHKLDLLSRLPDLGHAVYNLEAFDQLPASMLGTAVRSAGGSFGCSPAATARVLAEVDDPAAHGYLGGLAADGSVPAVHPFDVFERGWVLADLQRADLTLPGMRPHLDALACSWTSRGCGMASHGIPADGDCSAVVFTVLRRAGYKLTHTPLDLFHTEAGYVTYPLELDPSASCNAHVLQALRGAGDPSRASLQSALEHLRTSRLPGGGWSDKWHISPYYTTAHAIEAVHGLDEELCRDGIAWVKGTQLPDGSWGIAGGSPEETAYSLTALLAAREHLDSTGRDALDRGARYLGERLDVRDHPELWVGKALYAPTIVIRGLILATAWRCVNLTGRSEP